MDKIKLAKTVVGFVVGAGASKIAAQVIANNTNPENIKDQILIISGSVAIGGIVADASKKYSDAMIDQIAELYNETIKPKFNK